jgi:hypothetical protein
MRPHTFVNDKYFSYANAEFSIDSTRGTRMPPINYGETNVKPIGKIEGIMFIKKKNKLAEYKGFRKRLRDLIEKSKTSLGGNSDLLQSEIAQLRKKIETIEIENANLIAKGSSQAIPNEVIQAVMVNPNITDAQLEVTANSSETTTTPEQPTKVKKMNVLLPIVGVSVVLYFLFRKK